MGWDSMVAGGLSAGLMLLLVSAGIEDVRRREIADGKTIAVALMAPLWWWAAGLSPWPDVAVQLMLAATVFALFAAAFSLGVMGGGDVKLIAALALWFPWREFAQLLVVMSWAGGAVTLAMLADSWRRRAGGAAVEVPYGVAIAVAGLAVLARTRP